MPKKKVRHILGLSGGKDSSALAVLMHREVPEMEYFFCDTGKELPETYKYLDKLRARLGIKIHYLEAERGFDHWLSVYGGFLPAPNMRWCTKKLKIEPLEKFIGNDEAISYVGIRADEDRTGYIFSPLSSKRIKPVYPFIERGMVLFDIKKILEEHGLGLPEYYRWRSRSGCFFCFFQRKHEWIMLHEKYPELYKEAMRYEEEHEDGRSFYWNDREPLRQLLLRKEEILADYEKRKMQDIKQKKNKPLSSVLPEDEDFVLPRFDFLD